MELEKLRYVNAVVAMLPGISYASGYRTHSAPRGIKGIPPEMLAAIQKENIHTLCFAKAIKHFIKNGSVCIAVARHGLDEPSALEDASFKVMHDLKLMHFKHFDVALTSGVALDGAITKVLHKELAADQIDVVQNLFPVGHVSIFHLPQTEETFTLFGKRSCNSTR